MSTAHCLTVEVKGQTNPNTGAGYMIAFSLPANLRGSDPAVHPCFAAWSTAVRDLIVATSDLPFHPDAYTRKTALANLMHDLAELNRRFPLRIGISTGDVPAVQIHSTNPLARQIELNFTDEDGAFSIVERNPQTTPTAEVREQGRIGLMAAARKAFPFDKPGAARTRQPRKPPAIKPSVRKPPRP